MKQLRWVSLLVAFVLLAINVMSVISGSAANTVTVRGTSGDITGDGVINSKDLIRLARYISSDADGSVVIASTAAADVTGDGVINTKDLTRLMKYLASSGDGSIQLADMDVQVDTASVFAMTETDGGYRITAYKGTYESVTIPTTYNGKSVDSIAAGAFAGTAV